MSAKNVDISFNNSFGSKGSSAGQFDYPSGITIEGSQMFVVDKQNHRIQVFDLNGNFDFAFGSQGNGDDEFYFPEDMCSNGVMLFVTDSSNHRIKVHDLSGVYINQFGTRGSGNDNFDYPVGIDLFGGELLIVDKQNQRVKRHRTNGLFEGEITGFNYPEGITTFNTNQFAVADSGNDLVRVFDSGYNALYNIQNNSFQYVVGVAECNEVLVVIDRQKNSFFNYNSNGELLSEYQNNFVFPIGIAYADDKVYLTDSNNHRIQIYDYAVNFEMLQSFQNIMNLTKQLYPTGRAWWMKLRGYFDRLHQGLALSEARAYEMSLALLFKILPDTENFTEEDAANWEKALGLITNTSLTLEERKTNIERKIQFPGTVLARQHHLYMQGELQKVGFNVFVNENRVPIGGGDYEIVNPVPAVYAQFAYGEAAYGAQGLGNFTKIANYIDETLDDSFIFGPDENLRATIFIGGATIGARADVDATRRAEFRELVLKLKPAQVGCFALIDYI
jgi:hypothetical protein